MDETTPNGVGESLPEEPTGDMPESPPAAPPVEEPPAWAGPSQQEWQQVTNALSVLAPYGPVLDQIANVMYSAPQQAPPEQQEQVLPEYDPFDPDSAQAYIEARIQQGIEQRVSPIEQQHQAAQMQRGQEIAQQRLQQLAGEIGEFDINRAEALAHLYAGAGYHPHQALAMAAQEQHRFEQELIARGAGQSRQQLENVAAAPREPGAQGGVPASELPEIPRGRGWGTEAAKQAAARLGIDSLV